MLTPQQIFDKAYLGVIGQGSLGHAEGGCRYRIKASDGRVFKCGIGQLIPDSVYDPSFDEKGGLSILSLVKTRSGFAEKMAAEAEIDVVLHQRLLHAIQRAHDEAAIAKKENQLGTFRQNMHAVAHANGLLAPR